MAAGEDTHWSCSVPDPDTLTIALRVSGAVDSLDPAVALLELTGP
jgi:hypothetical protein